MVIKQFQIYDIVIEIATNREDLFKTEAMKAFRHLKEIFHPGKVDFYFSYIDSEKENIFWDGSKSYILLMPYEELKFNIFEIFKVIIDIIVQYCLQSKGYFMLHASAVKKNNENLKLFFGSSGSGKTILSLYLTKYHNWKFVSNGSVILKVINDQIYSIGSLKKDIKLRISSFKQAFPKEINIYFPTTVRKTFDNKITVSPSELGIIEDQTICKLESFNQIKLLENSIGVSSLDPYRTSLILYEDLSRFIRGNSIIFYGNEKEKSILLPSLDNKILHKKRVELINKIVSSYLGKYYIGSPGKLSEFIHSEKVFVKDV